MRFPDPTANPYLAFTAMMMAGLDGIQNKIHPGDPADKNLYDLPPEEDAKIPTVCSSLDQALDYLDKDREFLTRGGVFSNDFIDAYIDLEDGRSHPLPHDDASGRVRHVLQSSKAGLLLQQNKTGRRAPFCFELQMFVCVRRLSYTCCVIFRKTNMKLGYLFAVLCVCPMLVHAEIYKSVDENGHVTYSSTPSQRGQEAESGAPAHHGAAR